MKKSFILLVMLALLVPEVIYANDLKAPMELSSTQVLPKGIRNAHFRSMIIKGNDKFNPSGSVVPLSDPFFKNVTWQDLVDAKTESENKNLLAGYLAAKGVNLGDEVGKTTGDVKVEAVPLVPIIAYGVNEKLTLALAVPVIQYQANVDTGFLANDNLKAVYQKLADDGKYAELSELSRKMINPATTKLNDFSYQPLRNEKRSIMGDLSMTGKYSLLKQDLSNTTMQMALTLPTGKKKDESKVISIGSEGIWSVGATLIQDYSPEYWVNFVAAAGYTYKVPDTLSKRVPYRQDSKVTPDIDDKTDRKLGDEMFAQAGVKLLPYQGLTFSTGYTLQYKNADEYSGSRYSGNRYEWMSANSIQRMETITVGLRLDTIELYKQGAFKVPMDISLNHSVVVRGKNASKDPLTMLDASLFF